MGSYLSSDASRLNQTQIETGDQTNLNNITGGQQPAFKSDLADRMSVESDDMIPMTDSGQMNTTNTTTSFTDNTNHLFDYDDFSVNLFGYVLYPFRWLAATTMTSWLKALSSIAMIIGCVLPYVPQYTTIHRTRSCAGFSTFVCLTLLIANILRIAFWFGHPFELPLLIQSIIMILAQILLLELCVRVKRQTKPLTKQTFFSSSPRWFWRWTDLSSYLEFLFILSTLLGLAVYFFLNCKLFIETLGFCALIIESMLGLPQVMKNYKNRSVRGMSLSMVLMWLAGDTFKTGYFIFNAVPYQFWLCGLLQISIDFVILCQVCLYKQSAPMKWAKEMMPF